MLAGINACRFTLLFISRPGGRSGGEIGLLYTEGADFLKLDDDVSPGFEYASWKVKLTSVETYILGIIIPHHTHQYTG